MVTKSLLRISENYTLKSDILESVKIKSVGVDAHCKIYYFITSFLQVPCAEEPFWTLPVKNQL